MKPYQSILESQKAYFATGITRSKEWRVGKVDCMARMISQNEKHLQCATISDFRTARAECASDAFAELTVGNYRAGEVKSRMAPTEAHLPHARGACGQKAIIDREPFGVGLVFAPSDRPSILLLQPILVALAAGNTCILKLSERQIATTTLLTRLVPQYFDRSALAVVGGDWEDTRALMKLPFDFILFTGSSTVGSSVLPAAGDLTSVVFEPGVRSHKSLGLDQIDHQQMWKRQ